MVGDSGFLKKSVGIWPMKIHAHGITNFALIAVPDNVGRNCYQFQRSYISKQTQSTYVLGQRGAASVAAKMIFLGIGPTLLRSYKKIHYP